MPHFWNLTTRGQCCAGPTALPWREKCHVNMLFLFLWANLDLRPKADPGLRSTAVPWRSSSKLTHALRKSQHVVSFYLACNFSLIGDLKVPRERKQDILSISATFRIRSRPSAALVRRNYPRAAFLNIGHHWFVRAWERNSLAKRRSASFGSWCSSLSPPANYNFCRPNAEARRRERHVCCWVTSSTWRARFQLLDCSSHVNLPVREEKNGIHALRRTDHGEGRGYEEREEEFSHCTCEYNLYFLCRHNWTSKNDYIITPLPG